MRLVFPVGEFPSWRSINSTLLRSQLSFFLLSLLQHPTCFNLLLPVHCSRTPPSLVVPFHSVQTTPLQSIFRRQTSSVNSSTSQYWSYEQSPAADGTDLSRTAVSSLLFSLPTILLGLLLLLGGRILLRFSSSLGFAIAAAFPTWALCVNLVGVGGLTGRSSNQVDQNLAIWGLVAGAFLFGLTIGLLIGQHVPRIGLHLLSIHSGFALAVSILIFFQQLATHYVWIRWILFGLLVSFFALLTIISRPSIGTSVACATSGSFLLFLGIDLLAEQNSGMSLGIRLLFDRNHQHAKDLAEYHPPTVTRILLIVSWACMLLGSAYQYKLHAKPLNFTWLPRFHQKPNSFVSQSTILIDQDLEESAVVKEVNRLSALSSTHHSLKEPSEVEGLSSVASPQPQEFESPSESDQRCTTDSFDTGLSAIPELTEQSSSGRGGSRNGSGSARGGTGIFTHSHRHPSNSTYNSIRRSTLSSEHQTIATAPASLNGVADPSSIPVSPPLTVLTETTVFPDDSVSQAARQRLGLTIYSRSGLIEEETEVMATPVRDEMSPIMGHDDSQDNTHRLVSVSDRNQQLSNTPLLSHPTSPGSTGVLTRLARAFGDASTSAGRPSAQLSQQDYHCMEEAGEDQALQSDAERWIQLKDGKPPYGHAARLRTDLHSWCSEEPN